jgi:hypothetical protein
MAATANNVDAILHPRRWRRRLKNILLAKLLNKLGMWKIWQ